MSTPAIVTNGSEIAIIGLAGRFPGAKNVDEFWQNLQNGAELISFFTNEELLASGIDPADINAPNYVKAGAMLDDVEFFDAAFFGFNPREAEITDPQHRLFLECAWQALENAGYDSESYKGSIGVYAGSSFSGYLLNAYLNQNILIDPNQLAIAGDKDYLTTRVSYKLNLTGPSYTVQTACSTSLVAVHLGCQSLLSGECDMALAGGVSIGSTRKAGYFYTEGGIGSPDGHCRAFDAKAQGTVGGEGVGIVVLKRLEDAIADRDLIYAVIKGSAINNDGSLKVSYTAPRIDGQAKVIKTAQLIAEVEPETITYIEAHGTGTSLGDPIEVAALTQVFRTSTQKKSFCAIGSVKTNIGHLDAAAGIAALIKTALALKHKQIPPSLHFQQPNPQIDFANSPFYVNSKLSPWQANGNLRRAGVSSFGIGGTNVHAILEEAQTPGASSSSRSWQLLLLSATTETALETATANLAAHLQQNPELNLADVAYTLQVGRRSFDYRRLLVCQNLDDAVKALKSPDSQRVVTKHQKPCNRPVVFMFSPQGTQYQNMALELYQTEPVFTAQVDNCAELLKPHLGLDLREILFPSAAQAPEAAQLTQTAITQPALFVIEYALAQLWMSWGVHPQAAIGHSIGEYVAATLAEVFSLESALALVATRGKLMQQLPKGSMLSVQLSRQEVQPLLSKELSLAANNSPHVCVVSGSCEAIQELQNQLTQKGIGCRQLHTSGAFHSHLVEAMVKPFTEILQKIQLNPPKIPFISNVSGTWITVAEAVDPNYWAQHLRQPVLFSEGITELLKEPERILLEVGPGKTLCSLAIQHQTDNLVTLSSLRHPQEKQSDVAFLLDNLGRLWLAGVQVDWASFYTHEQRDRLPLPTYPFERQRYWIEPAKQPFFGRQFQPKPTITELWQSLVKAAQIQARAGISELDAQTYLANKQYLDRLCIAYINLALRSLNAFSNPSKKYSLEELLEQCQIIPRYQQLLCRWLDVLVEQGHLQQEQKLFTNLAPCSTEDLNALLKEVKVRYANTPQVLDIVEQCGKNLDAVLIGEQEPLKLYLTATDDSTENSHLELPLNAYLKKIMRASLEQVVELLPPEVNLKILEIGGGTGIATTELLPILPQAQTKYTFTDVGGFFLKEAKNKFSNYPFVEYRLLDIEKPPTEQGYSSHSFDVVVAVNVLHVTRNIEKTLEHVRSLLAPGGFLLLWELTQPRPEFDITDGLLMNLLEDKERSRGNPFLSKEQWQAALHTHGFTEVTVVSETQAFSEEILMAQASVTEANSTAFTTTFEQKNVENREEDLLGKKPDIADWFYIPSWKRSIPPQLSHQNIGATESGCWLVFIDDCGLGDKIVKKLELAGQDVVSIRIGEQFTSNSQQSLYTLNPQHKEHYDTLVAELCTIGKIPHKIVHLWNLTQSDRLESSMEFLEKTETLSFYSLLFLAQALGEQHLTNAMEIGVISNNLQQVTGAEMLCPEKALILGPVKVMPLEYSHINCRSIDVVLPTPDSWQQKQLVAHLLAEMTSPTDESVIAYRGCDRWVQQFEPIRLQGTAEENPHLRKGGVYLITGGLGGVGLVLAEYLAEVVQAKLVLVGRSTLPTPDEWQQWLAIHDHENEVSQKIRKLQNIQAAGAEVMVVSANIANLEQMSAVIQQTKQRFGEIHGVIHAAGVPGGGMMQLMTPDTAASSLSAKVRGTLVLDTLFKNEELDFFVLCSSLASFFGTPGMMDYTAESAFLDAYAGYKVSIDDTFTTSINWDRWNSLGMAVAVEARHKELTKEELPLAMTSFEGIEAFKRILSSSQAPQIIVSTQDFQTMIQPIASVKSLEEELAQAGRAKSSYHRPNQGNAYIAPRNEVERTIADIWQNLLAIDKIGISDNFFELGGDSLFATILVAQLCKTFQIELSYKSFFDAPTVAELADIILQKLTQQSDNEELAKALAEIEQLSEQEVNKIIYS